ncbi:MAG: efflux RND transporter periplasmic adaptor subunit [Magnetovibrionaceae bacterium]
MTSAPYRPLQILLAVLMLPLLGLSSASPAQAQRGPSMVGVDEVRTEQLTQQTTVLGRLVATRSGEISARIGGAVEEVLVAVGDRVEVDQIVATLVKDSLIWRVNLAEAQVEEARAALATHQATVDLRRQELARLTSLSKSAAFSKAQRDDKRQELVQAQASLGEAQAAVARAEASKRLDEIALYNADIRALFAGVVTRKHTEAGAYLQQGAPVIEVVDDSTLEIEADVPVARIEGLQKGVPATVTLFDDTVLQARVRAVVPDENPRTRTRTVRFTAAKPDLLEGRAANQSVSLDIPQGAARNVVSVHKDAILNRNGGQVVFVVAEGDAGLAASPRKIRIGEAVGNRFEVLDGLAPGDLVAVRGNERLRPGQAVAVMEQSTPDEALAGKGEAEAGTVRQ